MLNHSDIDLPSISIPKIGDNKITTSSDHLEVNLFSGAAEYTFPLDLSKARGLNPQLTLGYHSSSRNSLFGWGFDLSIGQISRSTLKGVPTYNNDNDTFILEGSGELVRKQILENNPSHSHYNTRLKRNFSQIEHISEKENNYWIVRGSNGVNHIFGKTFQAKISDPKNKSHIFSWLLEESIDAKGNKIVYKYDIEEGHSNRYIKSIQYGNYKDQDKEYYAFEIIFDYGEYDLNIQNHSIQNKIKPSKSFTARSDSYISYISGFGIEAKRCCQNILLMHHFSHLNEDKPFLVKRWSLKYFFPDKMQVALHLQSIQQYGYKRLTNGEYLVQSIPAISLEYSDFKPSSTMEKHALQIDETTNKAGSLILPGNLLPFKFVDLYREGLPGILYSDDTTTLYWRNQGEGKFLSPEFLGQFPCDRNINNSHHLMDIGNSNQLSLVVGYANYGGFYTSLEEKGWESFQVFEQYPTSFTDVSAEFLDVNGSGSEDLVIMNSYQTVFYPSLGKNGFDTSHDFELPSDFPISNLAVDIQTYIGFTHLLGDGLFHRIKITHNQIDYWPNCGHGKFGEKITLEKVPDLGEDFDSSRLFLVDIKGTGTVDIVYVSSREIKVYVNQQGRGFSPDPITITLPEEYSHTDQIRVVDLLGKGTACLIFTKNSTEFKHYYYDFAPLQKPYLLKKIDNGFGYRTELNYISSVQCYANDQKQKRTPLYKCSFPVSVVSEVIKKDNITNTEFTERYQFHDGYYAPEERQFVGFGYVEHWGSNFSSHQKSLQTPPCYTKMWYHCGAKYDNRIIESNSLSLFYQNEYDSKDLQAWRLSDSTLQFSENVNNLKNLEELHRQASYSLRGSLLRKEIYQISTDNQKKDSLVLFSASENNFNIFCMQIPLIDKGLNLKGVFSVLPSETLSYDYQGYLNDPILHTQLI
jgi:hypothetical protein